MSKAPQGIQNESTAVARQFSGKLDAKGFPAETAWELASPVCFDADWQGKNSDPARQTEVRVLWTKAALLLRFVCRYRTITVFEDSETNGRRFGLWDRDVAEIFLQTSGHELHHYLEFEVSPNGFWIDLDIAPGAKNDPKSGLRRRVELNEQKKKWTAELSIPMKSLAEEFDPRAAWRVNFFRIEGPVEPRFYSAWRPTKTPQPNFHVPEEFGKLLFRDAVGQ